jgi:TrmH family RNA methyltransferase
MPLPTITSLQNPRVKRAVALRDRRDREREGRFLIDGAAELLRALDAGIAIDELFVCEPLCTSNASRAVLARTAEGAEHLLHVAPPVFEKLAYGQRAEGVLAVAVTPHRTLDELIVPANPLVAVLERIEKPGNIGAVLRSADGAGVSAVIVAGGLTDLYNPNVVRASLGTLFTVPVVTASSGDARHWLLKHGLRIFAARVDAARLYTEADYRGGVAMVLGSEAEGLSGLWSDDCTAVKLPMLGAADSLNVSATAAVLFYEALRQRSG